MPSQSQKQHDFMVKVVKSKEFAEAVEVEEDVAREYLKKDAEEDLYQTGEEPEEYQSPNNPAKKEKEG